MKKTERIRQAEPGLFDELRSKLARFAEDYREQVLQARPPLPSSLNDRAQDNWEPLLAIAMTAGPEWLQLGITAALKLSGGESASQTIGTELLSDIQEIFWEKQVVRISTADLIRALCADDEKLWLTYNKGSQITPKQLAGKLKSYGIQSKTIRMGYETAKGYEREQFEDAFFRYTHTTENSRHPSQPIPTKDLPVTDTEYYPSRYGCGKVT
jgi:putative DNA primase/helicase